MNEHFKTILNFIQQSEHLSAEEKNNIIKLLKDANKELEVTSFKLDRTEKVKRTTAILLEETIEELEQKRKAVEAQNRELEIESSLERVRTVAMSMKVAADMLDVCYVISAQLELLNVKQIRNVQTAIFYKEKGTYMNYEYYARHDKKVITETSYTNSEMHTAFAAQMMKGAGEFFSTNINGDAVKDWIAYQKTTNVFIDDYLYTASSLNYYWHSLGPVALGLSTYEPLKEEDKNLFRRFVKVFELAYRRYLDIEKAEAQAREAKIEAALENVRSRSLAVHKTNEFKEVVKIVFEKLGELGIQADAASINIFNEKSKELEVYIGGENKDGLLISNFHLLYFDDVISNDRYNAQKTGIDFFSKTYSQKDKNEFFKYQFEFSEMKNVPDDIREKIFDSEQYTLSMALAKHSMIVVNSFDGKLLSEKEKDILKRFVQVFEQAYVRFLDLQKAEAQARESQIELALERVRARTMAMQKSDELKYAAILLFQQAKALGVPAYSCGYNIWEKGKKEFTSWMSTQDGSDINGVPNIPLTEDANFIRYVESKQNGEPFFVLELRGERMQEHCEYLKTIPAFKGYFDYAVSVGFNLPQTQIHHVANFSQGNLLFITLQPCPEFHDVFKRFAAVFEQTYTRFLDLQKAEAQAREAQIEAALERVRSRTMGMQRSEELKEVIQVVYEQFVQLNILIEHTGFIMDYKGSEDMNIWLADQRNIPSRVTIPYFDSPHWNSFIKAKENDIDFFANYLSFEEKNSFYQELFKLIPGVPEETKEYYFNCPALAVSTVLLENVGLYIENFLGVPYTDEENNTLMRFGKVFQQTYTRFLDLKKAEAQSRESQIQLALERVRARTMAMQKSDELADVATLLFRQVNDLGIKPWTAGFNIWSDDNNAYEDWIASPAGGFIEPYIVDATAFPEFKALSDAKKSGTEFFIRYQEGETLKETYKQLSRFANKNQFEKILEEGFQFPSRQFVHLVFGSKVSLMFITYEPVPEAHDIFIRFGKVFEQTYTRFLDLQKAEAQAREAKIEAALEKVRSRTMAMQKSDELPEAATLLFQQVQALGMPAWSAGYCTWGEDKKAITLWMSSEGVLQPPFKAPLTEDPSFIHMREAQERGETFYMEEVSGEELVTHYKYMRTLPVVGEILDSIIEAGHPLPTFQIFHLAYFSKGFLLFITYEPVPEAHDIFKRFAKIFEQTYTRFLDLQRAEAQAREAKIEAALERVRAKTMAMHNSEDVADTVATMFDQLAKLGIETLRCGIGVMHEPVHMEVWTAKPGAKGVADLVVGQLNMTLHPLLDGGYRGWKNKKEHYQYELEGNDLINYFTAINNYPGYPVTYDIATLPNRIFHNEFYFPEGTLYVFSLQQLSPDAFQVFKRFASVFGQTYRRYLDLVNAEAQTRQAKIEGAMEKVRARAMAMQNPEELIEVAELLRREMGLLGMEELETSSIYIHNDITGKTECWYAIKEVQHTEKELVSDHMTLDLTETSVGKQMLAFYESTEKQISISMNGAARREWINYCADHSKVLAGFYGDSIPDRTYHLYKFSNGYMGAASPGDISAESWDLLQRATSVFSLAYTRFSDLQLAEASAKEAVKQAALDRVRAEIASMRTISDLDRITPLIWNELNILGVPFIRCGVFIMDDSQALIHTFLSAPDGKAIAAFHLPYATPGNIVHVLSHWQKKQSYIDHWDESAFTEFAGVLVNEGGVVSAEQYLKTIPRGGFYLHFLPFLQGMLYVGNTTRLGNNEIILIQSLAEAFSTAYSRYEDFNKLEAAKKQVDNTLNELQVTQRQLIQSEKMASLGELTAGIAHEIQNPLNFVNNFSEVSKELLDEMKTALQNGDQDDAKEIADDVIQNLEKINHHGKRADAIVKGMLQHSRSGTGKKEPTDVNALCDEYIRLCYHGLRAKDNSFNAAIKTDFDSTIEKMNIIPQDIGRVILNVLTNAFYAVNERKKTAGENYKPTISIQTKKLNDKIQMSVEDNGNGISQNILDKIFQPFFTTKPTGQGTGLGLSLSYDIIKTHGGEIKVETIVQGGSKFIIQLPVTG